MLLLQQQDQKQCLGDTAVAVHPDDERYKDLIGTTVVLPIINKEIPILADEIC